MSKFVTFFGSYKVDKESEIYKTAYELSYELTRLGYTIINGGGKGIMQASREGAIKAGGNPISVIIRSYKFDEYEKNNAIITDNLFDRLRNLIEKSSLFIVFPGGTGTLCEIAILLDLLNKNLIRNVLILCYKNYWKRIIDFLNENSYYVNTNIFKTLYFFENKESALLVIKDFLEDKNK